MLLLLPPALRNWTEILFFFFSHMNCISSRLSPGNHSAKFFLLSYFQLLFIHIFILLLQIALEINTYFVMLPHCLPLRIIRQRLQTSLKQVGPGNFLPKAQHGRISCKSLLIAAPPSANSASIWGGLAAQWPKRAQRSPCGLGGDLARKNTFCNEPGWDPAVALIHAFGVSEGEKKTPGHSRIYPALTAWPEVVLWGRDRGLEKNNTERL